MELTMKGPYNFISNTYFWKYCRIKTIFKYIVFFTLSVTILGISTVFIHFQFYIRCSDDDGLERIRQLCQRFHTKKIVGGMCSRLCDDNVFRFTECAGNTKDKSVQILECDGCIQTGVTSKVVVKSEKYDSFTLVKNDFLAYKTNTAKIGKTIRTIVTKVKNRFQIDIARQPNLLDFFLGDNYTRVVENLNTSKADEIVLKNILALVSQDEYLAMKVFSNVSFIPKLYGTCGQTYFVEYAPPLSSFNHVLFQGKISEIIKFKQRLPSWSERAQIALKILDLIRDIENEYDRPLRICDSSPSNYGVTKTNKLVLPDLGAVYFQIPERVSCVNDSQCGRLGCRGVCDVNGTGRCKREMTDTNLQVICEYIFLSKVEKFGLLRTPPDEISGKLKDLLYRCAYTSPRLVRLPEDNYSDENMLKELENLLQNSLHLQGSLRGYFTFS